MSETINIVNVSGGKDSACVYLLALEQGVSFRSAFADTGHEHPLTYEFVDTLSAKTGGPRVEVVRADFTDQFEGRKERIRKRWAKEGISAEIIERACSCLVPSGNSFLDLCMLRGGFPSPKRKFCTEHLKIVPIREAIYKPIWERGDTVCSWLGMRRDESPARVGLSERSPWNYNKSDGATEVYRPILNWKIADVWAMHKKHGLEPNALYGMGSNRVGCYPCIMSRKFEIRSIAKRFPEFIDKIRSWEETVAEVGKRDPAVATFFSARDLNLPGPIQTTTHGIDAQVKWSKTRHGGSQYEMDLGLEAELFGPCAEQGFCEI